MPHALFFVGPEGAGKRTFARMLAKGLLCEETLEEELDPCGACPGCVQVEEGTHPDLLEAARPAERSELPIQVIRDLCAEFGLKPARGLRKVAIVDDMDDMNDEAANAFLKTLEEPPPGAVLILIGTSQSCSWRRSFRGARLSGSIRFPKPSWPNCSWSAGWSHRRARLRRLAALGEGA